MPTSTLLTHTYNLLVRLKATTVSPFLDTTTIRANGRIKVNLYRKPTHTDKYLDFYSHHPAQHKRSVVNTLLDRAEKIPSTNRGKRKEKQHVMKVLMNNKYPLQFIKKCDSTRKARHRDSNTNNTTNEVTTPFVVLPYVKGVTERVSRHSTQQRSQSWF